MKKIMYLLLLGFLALNFNLSAQTCDNFSNGNSNGWAANNGTTISFPSGYLRAEDDSGYSRVFKDFASPTNLGCTQICFDYNIFDDGNNSTVTTVFPSIILYQGNIPMSSNGTDPSPRLVCRTTNGVNENMGWVNNCVSIPSDFADLPANWSFTGTSSQFSNFIANVAGIAFPVDLPNAGSLDEDTGIDNVCISQSNQNVSFTYYFSDQNGVSTTSFTESETVYLIPNAQFPDGYRDFWVQMSSRPIGSGSWGNWQTPGWSFYTQLSNPFNVTQYWANNGVTFQDGYEYRMKIALSDANCNTWVDFTAIFEVENCPACDAATFSFHYEDQDGVATNVFHENNDPVYLVPNAQFPNGYLDFWVQMSSRPIGSGNWGNWQTPGWSFNTQLSNPFNVTQYWASKGVIFQEGYEYRMKIALSDRNCNTWVDFTDIFSIIDCVDNSFARTTTTSSLGAVIDETYEITASPNPATSALSFTLSQESSTNGTIEIFGADGMKVISLQTDGASRIEADISHLSSGIYFYRHVTDDYQSKVKKLVVK